MTKRDERAREIQESIRHILFYDWDPIGVNDLAPDDEYDSYVGGIYRLLASDAAEYQIIEHLQRLAVTQMEVGGDKEKAERVAKKLKNLNVSI